MADSTNSSASGTNSSTPNWTNELKRWGRLKQLAMVTALQHVRTAEKNTQRRQDKHLDWMYEQAGSGVRVSGEAEEDELINLGDTTVYVDQPAASQQQQHPSKLGGLAKLLGTAAVIGASGLGGAALMALADRATDTDTDTNYEMRLVLPDE